MADFEEWKWWGNACQNETEGGGGLLWPRKLRLRVPQRGDTPVFDTLMAAPSISHASSSSYVCMWRGVGGCFVLFCFSIKKKKSCSHLDLFFPFSSACKSESWVSEFILCIPNQPKAQINVPGPWMCRRRYEERGHGPGVERESSPGVSKLEEMETLNTGRKLLLNLGVFLLTDPIFIFYCKIPLLYILCCLTLISSYPWTKTDK